MTTRKTMIKLDDDKKLFFISDAHFMHENIIGYCNRPFKNAREMTETIIRNWNDTISNDDQVIFLGDFVVGCKNPKDISEYIYGCLNGEKFFIRGNHDSDDKISDKVNWIKKSDDNLYITHYKGYDLVLSHFPFERKHLKPLTNRIMIHGHTHSKTLITDINNSIINVSCEAVNYTPLAFDKILEVIK